jgi:hypothetical protein
MIVSMHGNGFAWPWLGNNVDVICISYCGNLIGMFFVIVHTSVNNFSSCSVVFFLVAYLLTLKSYNLSIQVCISIFLSFIFVCPK